MLFKTYGLKITHILVIDRTEKEKIRYFEQPNLT